MFGCDYNGWTDVPEAEREAIEAFELATGTSYRRGASPGASALRARFFQRGFPSEGGIVRLASSRES